LWGYGRAANQRIVVRMNATKVCAAYVRVSTDRQTVDNQVAEVQHLARARGYEPVIYDEVESAAKARPVLDRMLADVRAGRVQAVAVWGLDSGQAQAGVRCVLPGVGGIRKAPVPRLAHPVERRREMADRLSAPP
jgi:hypothetical protein